MKWQCKAALQLVFSHVPFGEALNYASQRYVTKSLPASDSRCATMALIAKEHLASLQRYGDEPVSTAVFYEFGAGWDLMVPLTFYGLGANRQILIDIQPLLRVNLVNSTIRQLSRLAPSLALARAPVKLLSAKPTHALHELREHYGIEYRAPRDARATGLEAGSVDYITSTNTLEHVQRSDIQAILLECGRILKKAGSLSFRIDYQDHYSYFDGKISAYNFLQYSDRAWRVFNPTLHYQNRLRHRDYLDLAQAAGFEIIEQQRVDGTPADIATLSALRLHHRFKTYSLDELAVRGAFLILGRR